MTDDSVARIVAIAAAMIAALLLALMILDGTHEVIGAIVDALQTPQ